MEVTLRNYAVSLQHYGVSSEIIALCDEAKWRPAKQVRIELSQAGKALIWPSFSLGSLCRVSGRLLYVHLFPAHISFLLNHLKNFDVIHYHDDADLSFPLACLRLAKPRLFTCHTFLNTFPTYERNRLMRELLVNSADIFHVFSTMDAVRLTRLGVCREDIRVIPNGVDTNVFRPSSGSRRRRRVRVVFVGRLTRNKGVMELLEAIRKLKQRNEKTKAAFQVLIVGKPWNAEYYRQLLHNKNKGLQEVTFVGFVENLPAFLRDADLFVCPSLADTNPTVNLQAMASGLPIIASSVGAIPETVIDGQTGFLVRPGDSSELAEKLSLMVDDYKLRREMGREGRVRAERLFSIDRIAGLMFNTYKELLARNANQRKN